MPQLAKMPELREFDGVYKSCWDELPLHKKGAAVMYGVGNEFLHLPLQFCDLGINVVHGIVKTFTDAISKFFSSIGETWSDSMFRATLSFNPRLKEELGRCLFRCSAQVIGEHLGFSADYIKELAKMAEEAMLGTKSPEEFQNNMKKAMANPAVLSAVAQTIVAPVNPVASVTPALVQHTLVATPIPALSVP